MVFSDKKPSNNKQRRGASFHESAVTILTPGCHFNGKLFCRGSSRIGGKIEGEIISEGLLIIEEEAFITAKIKADEVVIQGQVEGELQASGRVKLESTSKFTGDIVTPSLVINEGSIFNGNTKMLVPEKLAKPVASIPVVEKIDKKNLKYKDKKGLKIPEIGVKA
ncbi:MAG: polymer-forming cytoskeletal protein [Oligoflexales bacterium]